MRLTEQLISLRGVLGGRQAKKFLLVFLKIQFSFIYTWILCSKPFRYWVISFQSMEGLKSDGGDGWTNPHGIERVKPLKEYLLSITTMECFLSIVDFWQTRREPVSIVIRRKCEPTYKRKRKRLPSKPDRQNGNLMDVRFQLKGFLRKGIFSIYLLPFL